MRWRWVVAAGLALLLSVAQGSANAGNRAHGRFIVKFREGVATASLVRETGDGFRVGAAFGNGRFRAVEAPKGLSPFQAMERLARVPGVEYVEPDHIARINWVPNDPRWPDQWNFRMIGVDRAWDTVGGGDPGVVVAVVDTGVAYEDYGIYRRAPDLAGTVFTAGYDFVNEDSHPNDDHGHGTHIAGTIAQTTNNGEGVAGIAFRSTLMPLKALERDGTGYYSDAARAIYWAVDHGADVINVSFGGSEPSTTLYEALRYAWNRGAVVVAAAGNDATSVQYPARYNDVCISVGAVGANGLRASYSNYGAQLDLVAPGGGSGGGIVQQTLYLRNPSVFSYQSWTGTSMAAPHVAGAAALLKAMGISSPDEIESLLVATATDKGASGWDAYYGYGLVDVAAAVAASGGTPPEPPPEPSPDPEPIPPPPEGGVVVDDGDPGTWAQGMWSPSSVAGGYDGDSLYCPGFPNDLYRWTPFLPASGRYDVYLWWTASPGRSTRVPVRVFHADGLWEAEVDQRTDGGQWNYMGTWRFSSGSLGYVEVSGENGQASADAVRFVPAEEPPAESNAPPEPVDDLATTAEDVAVLVDVLANDVDPDGESLHLAAVGQANHGTAEIAQGRILYTPPPDYWGDDEFTYTVEDTRGASAMATVFVTVDPVNDPPRAEADEAATQAGVPVDIPVADNDFDPDGDPLEVVEISAPDHGVAEFAAPNTVRYTPAEGFTGQDRFSYVVSDGNGGEDGAEVTVTVGAASPVPEVEVIVDDGDPGTSSGGWWRPSSVPGGYNGDSLYCYGFEGDRYRWAPALPVAGLYDVFLRWTASAGRSSAVPVTIAHATGSAEVLVDQTQNGGTWVRLGAWGFDAGASGYVEVSGENGQASADAVRLVLTGGGAPPPEPPPEPPPPPPEPTPGVQVIVDDGDPGTESTGTWFVSHGINPYGTQSLYCPGRPEDTYRWTPELPAHGRYRVFLWWTEGAGRSARVPVLVAHAAGTAEFTVDQTRDGGQWNFVGEWDFYAGTGGWVMVTGENGQACADAVLWVRVGDLTVPPPEPEPEPDPEPTPEPPPTPGSGEPVILDDGDPGTWSVGTWSPSSVAGGHDGDSLYCPGYGTERYRWTPQLPTSGEYEVYIWWTSSRGRSSRVPVRVAHRDGLWKTEVNQQVGGGDWHRLGRWWFDAGSESYVEVSGENGQASADAVKFLPVGP